MKKIKKLLSFVGVLCLLCITMFGNTEKVYADDGVARLTLFSSHDNSHSWIVIENLTEDDLIVGKYTLTGEDSVSIGTFGNKSSHKGIWYNIELAVGAADNVSVSMVVTKNQLATVTKTINANNSYSVRNKNCSTFASKVWNSVSSVDVSPGKVIHTPSALADSIEEMYPYTCENNAIMPEKTVYDIAYHTSRGIVYSNPFSNEDEGGSSSSRSRSYAIERQERQPLTSFTEKEKAFLDTYHK